MRRRRRFDTFSLSFLDIMSCGFGSVILLFMVINATMSVRSDELNRALSLEAEALEAEVSEGRENLVALRNSLAETEERQIRAQGASRRIIDLLEQKKQELSTMEADTLARRESIEKLKADLQSMEEASKRLSAASSQPAEQGNALRRIRGQGDRQYLTGLRLGGSRVLILLDSSASMLDETIVNIVRRRNLDPQQRRIAPKWRRAMASAEWLIANRYTRPEKLAIQGASNGGLLVGACMTQRPDLFGAAIPAVGVMDMLRFQEFTAGRFWVDDYGSSEDPEEFKALFAYSPYHNARPGSEYPAVLVTTADTDDRVVPGHSFKYAAAMQKAQAGTAPILIRIETRAGHGSGKPTDMIIEDYADRWAFLVKNLGMRLPEGYGD